jgi:hypothetical protein
MRALYVYPEGRPNRKTGPVIQQYVGTTQEQSRASCNGCALLKSRECYAQFGTPAMGFASMVRALKGGKTYTLPAALKASKGRAKYVRLGALGDPSAVTGIQRHVARIRKAGLGILAYTHFWASRGSHLIGQMMASCDDWAQAGQAIRAGWRATLHVKKEWFRDNPQQGTHKGVKYTLCPAQRPNPVQCTDCGLCDATRGAVPLILFTEHGPMDRSGLRLAAWWGEGGG